jgi:hypothetical protein
MLANVGAPKAPASTVNVPLMVLTGIGVLVGDGVEVGPPGVTVGTGVLVGTGDGVPLLTLMVLFESTLVESS